MPFLLGRVPPEEDVFELGFALEGILQGGKVVDGGHGFIPLGVLGVGLTLRQPENIDGVMPARYGSLKFLQNPQPMARRRLADTLANPYCLISHVVASRRSILSRSILIFRLPIDSPHKRSRSHSRPVRFQAALWHRGLHRLLRCPADTNPI